VFNETKVAGKWINSTTVDCMRPKNLTANEPYQISLVPSGLYRVIRFFEEVGLDPNSIYFENLGFFRLL
jgi:hypothetical protein